MSTISSFAVRFDSYLAQARQAQAESLHHDHRRQLFLSFLNDAFEIRAEDVEVEKFLQIDPRKRKKGWVDALFRDLVFEFKRNLAIERADGHRELYDYLRTLPHGAESVGLLTDGVVFEAYVLDPAESIGLRKTDEIDLGKMDAQSAFLWLDAYLFSQKNTPPTSADLVHRFGLNSPTYQTAARILYDLLEKVKTLPAVQVKLAQWRGVLSLVYGTPEVSSDELFVRHTFLNQFAKLLAYAALQDGIPRDDQTLAQVIDGRAFERFGVSNLGEIDFFAWFLDDPGVRDQVIKMLRRLAESLVVYDLTQINEDLLKQLYQNLVDPVTRHDLGEFYTPDWLAELTLREIDYRSGQSLLDPSCGSGTFLFMAIRRLADQGVTGWTLVDFAVKHIAGMDVHPLAVAVARINFLLAILPHMRGKREGGSGLLGIPVYMANALQTPLQTGALKGTMVVAVDNARDEDFKIPGDAAQAPAAFNEIIDLMDRYAHEPADRLDQGISTAFQKIVRDRFKEIRAGAVDDLSTTIWSSNLRLLNRLISEGRNSIWAYMLKNTSRPLILSAQKFDVIIGNPPWLSYRYIKDATYQKEVKALAIHYKLIKSSDVKLMTQLDLSTLFMTHCEATYLNEKGLIAFVMPRAVITGAKQHRPFQARGLSRVIDLLGVQPLFNIPSAILLRRAGESAYPEKVPTTVYRGRLPAHQIGLTAANDHLTSSTAETTFVGEAKTTLSPYYDQFKSGACNFPRNLCFVKPQQMINPGDTAFNPSMETDPDLDSEAKAPWKGIKLKGRIDFSNLYATLLSKNLMPFGVARLHLVALPVRINDSGTLRTMDRQDFLECGLIREWDEWFAPADKKWDQLKKETSQFPHLIDQYNYMQKLTAQRPSGFYKVLYNGSGVHLAACVMDTNGSSPLVYEYPTKGFIADYKTYYCEIENEEEAHFLCGLLNAPFVDTAIKKHQSRGKGNVGERDISRTPFEACAIPKFDAANADHLELARLSRVAHDKVKQVPLRGGVVSMRRLARAAIEAEIQAIDVIARRVLDLEPLDKAN